MAGYPGNPGISGNRPGRLRCSPPPPQPPTPTPPTQPPAAARPVALQSELFSIGFVTMCLAFVEVSSEAGDAASTMPVGNSVQWLSLAWTRSSPPQACHSPPHPAGSTATDLCARKVCLRDARICELWRPGTAPDVRRSVGPAAQQTCTHTSLEPAWGLPCAGTRQILAALQDSSNSTSTSTAPDPGPYCEQGAWSLSTTPLAQQHADRRVHCPAAQRPAAAAPAASQLQQHRTRPVRQQGLRPSLPRAGKVQLYPPEALHGSHVLIAMVAIVHIIYACITIALCQWRISRWKPWEERAMEVGAGAQPAHGRPLPACGFAAQPATAAISVKKRGWWWWWCSHMVHAQGKHAAVLPSAGPQCLPAAQAGGVQRGHQSF